TRPPRESTPESRAAGSEACLATHFSEVELLHVPLGRVTRPKGRGFRGGQEHGATGKAHACTDRARMLVVHDQPEGAGAGERRLGQVHAFTADTRRGLRHSAPLSGHAGPGAGRPAPSMRASRSWRPTYPAAGSIALAGSRSADPPPAP